VIVKNSLIIQNAKDRIIPYQSSSEIPAPILLYTDIALLLDCRVFLSFLIWTLLPMNCIILFPGMIQWFKKVRTHTHTHTHTHKHTHTHIHTHIHVHTNTNTDCRSRLDLWSTHRRDVYLTTHNIHKKNIHPLCGIRTCNICNWVWTNFLPK